MDKLLADSGIRLLHNDSVRVPVRQAAITLVGVGDLWSAEVEPQRAFPQSPPQEPVVPLAHNPDTKDVLRNHGWDLMLRGHTHGGQVIIPFDGPRFAAGP